MFGTYRLLLALAVAFSHAGLIVDGFNPGQWAVVCFYVLSGFLMERQFHKLAPLGGLRAFYLDRFLRIYPVYFAVALVGALVFPLGWAAKLVNFSLLPLNYYSFLHVPLLVGPAWSLACEAQFYLAVPFLAAAPTRALCLLLAMSLTFFAASVFFTDSGFWAYCNLPAVIFTFVSGMLIDRREWRVLRVVYAIAGVMFVIFSCSKWLSPHFAIGIHINMCVGYLIAIPAMAYLSRLSPQVAFDRFLGLFSYPLFLVHMTVLELLGRYGTGTHFGAYVLYSFVAAGILVVLVEQPSDWLRYRMRAGSWGGPNRI